MSSLGLFFYSSPKGSTILNEPNLDGPRSGLVVLIGDVRLADTYLLSFLRKVVDAWGWLATGQILPVLICSA